MNDLNKHLPYSFTQKKLELEKVGLTVLPDIFNQDMLDKVRAQVMDNLSLLKNTRPTRSSLHLAGFHRYPEFEHLHSMITCDSTVLGFLKYIFGGQSFRNTGISDITINRSQCWHKDLLRGSYNSLLKPEDVWTSKGEVFRIVLYLQDSSKLKIITGSHLEPISLTSDDYAEPADESKVQSVSVNAGSIVVMDVRTTHRGADESDFSSLDDTSQQRVLIATTLGRDGSKLTDQLEYGNSVRLRDWMQRHV